MTDYKQLCAELLDWTRLLIEIPDPPVTRCTDDLADLLARTRAALAEPEPEELTDEELMKLLPEDLHKEFANWSRIYAEQSGIKPGLFRVVLNTHTVDFARAVLIRWGRPAPEPADGEVAELVAWLRGAHWDRQRQTLATRAADLLERLSPPQPVPVSEKLRAARRPQPPSLAEEALKAVTAIKNMADDYKQFDQDVDIIHRALERLQELERQQ